MTPAGYPISGCCTGGMGYSHLDVKLTTMGCRKGVARRVYTGFAPDVGGKTFKEMPGYDGKNMSSEALSLRSLTHYVYSL